MDASALDELLSDDTWVQGNIDDDRVLLMDTMSLVRLTTIAAARAELAALRARVEDLELMLRAELSDCYGTQRYHGLDTDGRGNWWLELWQVQKHRGPSRKWALKDDGTGLPLLTAEARRALRGENEGKVST